MKQNQNILVCVTQQKTCERLIKKAASLIEKSNVELHVIHVAKNSWNFLDNDKEGEALEYLFGISKSVGANLAVLRSDNIVKTISDFAKNKKIGHIILGETKNDHSENYFFIELKNMLEDVDIVVVPQNEM